MNSNPLLVKSFLMGEIPFLKDRSLSLYKKYISDNKLNKNLLDSQNTEVISAYQMNPTYDLDFVFDKVDITNSKFFSKEEWIALGMILRSYKEVEGLNLLHFYNCLHKSFGNYIKGYILEGKSYTLYSYTTLPVTIKIDNKEEVINLTGLNSFNPYHFTYSDETKRGSLVEIEIIFSRIPVPKCTLVEGTYPGILGYRQFLVPEFLEVGEYSDRLIEFLAGTLITKLSNPKIISLAVNSSSNERRFSNNDGFYGKEVQL